MSRRDNSQWHWVTTFSLGLAAGMAMVVFIVALCYVATGGK